MASVAFARCAPRGAGSRSPRLSPARDPAALPRLHLAATVRSRIPGTLPPGQKMQHTYEKAYKNSRREALARPQGTTEAHSGSSRALAECADRSEQGFLQARNPGWRKCEKGSFTTAFFVPRGAHCVQKAADCKGKPPIALQSPAWPQGKNRKGRSAIRRRAARHRGKPPLAANGWHERPKLRSSQHRLCGSPGLFYTWRSTSAMSSCFLWMPSFL